MNETHILVDDLDYVERYAYSIGCKVFIALDEEEMTRAFDVDEEVPVFAGAAIFMRLALVYRYAVRYVVIQNYWAHFLIGCPVLRDNPEVADEKGM